MQDLKKERLATEAIVKHHQHRTARPLLRQVFQRWWDEVRISQRYELSTQASRQRILATVFRTWRLRLAEAHEREFLLAQAHCFRNMNLKLNYFFRWIEAQKEVQRIRSLEKVALCHWALNLQAKAWRAWMVYLVEVRSAHTRRKDAFQRFSDRLAKCATALWMGAAFRLRRGNFNEIPLNVSLVSSSAVLHKCG
ncbi:unnamed protein product [Mesocestoides corti]|uniref:Sfi1 domain-containing protein n=1 Tax=Mesocestoides corti TaxID=53468 RepID=A0A0R3U7M7_MESCO|nr:unnamed protein product [Mesocestoides corti]